MVSIRKLGVDRDVEDPSLRPGGQRPRANVVVEARGEWLVRVVEEDEELTRSFELESFAIAFAEGQRMRLGLADFKRL